MLFRLIPALIAIPRHSQLEEMNWQLRQKIAEHEAAEAELLKIKSELEEKVSERTAALERVNESLTVVAREAVHRSKNLLTVVSSIARQTARKEGKIDEYLKVFLGRISALSDATAAVIGDGFSDTADFGEIVRNQMKPLAMTFGDRIQIEGPALAVNAEAAQQISLAVHELSTNAQKYGALANPGGGVYVSWRIYEQDQEKQVVFVWSEDHSGKDEDTQPSQEGFGSKLLNIIVPGMLHGTAQRKVLGDRLAYELRFPSKSLNPDPLKGEASAKATRVLDISLGIA